MDTTDDSSDSEVLDSGMSVSEDSDTDFVPPDMSTDSSGRNRVVADVDMSEDSSSDSEVEVLTASGPRGQVVLPDASSSRGPRLPTASVGQRLLIPANIEDEGTGTIVFYKNFVGRYGQGGHGRYPMFFHGPLDAAVREATHRLARDRRLLAVYLHHDASVRTNVFCQQVLCAEGVVNLLSNHFITWGWDCTHESNRQMLVAAITKSFHDSELAKIQHMNQDRYPLIIVMSRRRATTEISEVISGATTPDAALVDLRNLVQQHEAQQLADIREEQEREARARVIQEQNQAYQESLRADKAKQDAKKADELRKQQEENDKLAEQTRIATERQTVAALVPPEPDGVQEGICSLRFRLPNGKIASRNFLKSETLKVLYDFLFLEGFSKDGYKILFSYPKRDVTELYHETETLGQVFNTKDVLFVETR